MYFKAEYAPRGPGRPEALMFNDAAGIFQARFAMLIWRAVPRR